MEQSPIRRAKELVTLSHDHHHGLMLCWKIRTGLAKNVDIERITKYCRWFYQNHLIPHFKIEEEVAFPVLGNDHPHITEALRQHRNLVSLFENPTPTVDTLMDAQLALNDHIRFEERIVFTEIQEKASPQQLKEIEAAHAEGAFEENTEDMFWK